MEGGSANFFQAAPFLGYIFYIFYIFSSEFAHSIRPVGNCNERGRRTAG